MLAQLGIYLGRNHSMAEWQNGRMAATLLSAPREPTRTALSINHLEAENA